MKTLIAYSSNTGNTKMVAEAIAQVVEADLIDIKDKPDIDKYENIILGYWGRRGRANEEGDEFLKKVKGKNVGLFVTLGAYPETEKSLKVIRYGVETLEENGNNVIASFYCQGKIDPALRERAKKRPMDDRHAWTQEREERFKAAESHPNQEDLKRAQETFKDFLKKIEK